MGIGPQQVVIVGGGIGGLATALALLRRGDSVRIFEQAPELKEIGAGLTISPNATRALISLGLGDAVAAIGSVPDESVTYHWESGDVIRRRSMGDHYLREYGGHYYHMHRADLHAALLAEVRKLAPDAVHTDHVATGVEQDETSATVRFTNGARATGDLVIGADGVRSITYATLFGATPPTFTNRVAWRAVVPAAAVADLGLAKMGSIPGPERTASWYNLRGGELINLVFMSRWDAWVDEDWRARATIDDVREAFVGWCPLTRELIERLPADGILRWGLFDRPPYEHWSQGHIAFVGDAVHPMLPYMGQGAAMAIEDAVILARLFDAEASQADALARYGEVRRPRTDWIQMASRQRADFWEKTDPRAQLGTAMADAHLAIYPYDAATAPLTAGASRPPIADDISSAVALSSGA
ncbi:FAD-dependent monooxygenase [Sphingomonas crocodyli]|nr:FAD-dependent monooxygenase [Sphingomonas crocodyli]